MPKPVPYVLIVRCFSIRFRDQLSAKIQLFHNMQVSSRKITQNNAIMSKITIFVPLLMYRTKRSLSMSKGPRQYNKF